MNTYTYTSDTISESQMLDYVHKMAYKLDPYVSSSFGPNDRMAFMQALYNMLRHTWYGLSIAQLRDDYYFQKRVMEAFVNRWQDEWLHTSLTAGKMYEKSHRQDVISGSCMGVYYIGEYCPCPEELHEAHNPVVWNGKARL